MFLASPDDLSAERKWFKETVDLLNLGFGDGANVEFESLGWEDTLAATGRGPLKEVLKEVGSGLEI